MKTHIGGEGIVLCNSPSITSVVNSANCTRCKSRLNRLLGFCLRVVKYRGTERGAKEMEALSGILDQLGISLEEE